MHPPQQEQSRDHPQLKVVESTLAAMCPPEALGRAFIPKRKKGVVCLYDSKTNAYLDEIE